MNLHAAHKKLRNVMMSAQKRDDACTKLSCEAKQKSEIIDGCCRTVADRLLEKKQIVIQSSTLKY